MPLPTSDRVVYETDTLAEVICQLRFPPILRIEKETPADFQDRIRKEYPLFREQTGIATPPGLPKEIANILKAQQKQPASYEFLSEDGSHVLTLNRDFLALKSSNYGSWRESFRAKLEASVNALTEVYSPAFFSRIGLRYVNVIDRERLKLKDANWKDLLREHIAGELNDSDIASGIFLLAHETGFLLEDVPGKVTLRHGLSTHEKSGAQAFIIDSDFHIDDRTEIPDAFSRLDEFNIRAGRLFRWCITDRLHTAMEPSEPR
jgi:uncharacterized protein (TIGR04255 family)